MHVGWVRDQGIGYLTAIAPFRHLIVYPLMMRDIGCAWRQSGVGTAS
jgi:hypothetical protein